MSTRKLLNEFALFIPLAVLNVKPTVPFTSALSRERSRLFLNWSVESAIRSMKAILNLRPFGILATATAGVTVQSRAKLFETNATHTRPPV
jgi:hypothetical protein